ncbi:MAG: carboxylating nicotinate-nucleotide diphosphorylase [Herpetosiphon sp.]
MNPPTISQEGVQPPPSIDNYLPTFALRQLLEHAVEEDLGRGDVTTDLLVPPGLRATAAFRSRAAGVVAGLPIVDMVLNIVDPQIDFTAMVPDGTAVVPNQTVATASGAARSLLRAERVALNLLQRLSGISTLTARYVDAVRGTKARIVDTRKTTPGLRALEKYAVRVGGGHNHRRDLSDAMLVKDNHLAALNAAGVTISDALKQARRSLPHTMRIEVEVDRLDQIEELLTARVDAILLDNMLPSQLAEAVRLIDGRALTEASGGVHLGTVAAIAAANVDLISVGALTHSAPALDIGLDWNLEA